MGETVVVEFAANESPNRGETKDEAQLLPAILETVESIARRLGAVEGRIAEIGNHLEACKEKEWYSSADVAEILHRSEFTVRERWCRAGRIECEKDAYSGRWKIPAREVERLRNGGALRPTT